MSNLDAVPLLELARRCTEETNKFYGQESHDPRYCFELFRRAICHNDQQAWERIYTVYRPLVFRWVRRHPSFVMLEEEAQYFVNRAFEKMWSAVTGEKWVNFPDLSAVLRYLQMCTHGVIVDFGRQKELGKELTQWELVEGKREIVDSEPAAEQALMAREQRHAILAAVNEELKSEEERRVIYAMFVLALKPREIVALHPDSFASVNDVYRVKENVMNRLRRSGALLQLMNAQ